MAFATKVSLQNSSNCDLEYWFIVMWSTVIS